MKIKKIISGILALLLSVAPVPLHIHAFEAPEDEMETELPMEQHAFDTICDYSSYENSVDLSDNFKIKNFISKQFRIKFNEKNRVYAFDQVFSGSEPTRCPPYYFVSIDENSGVRLSASGQIYPVEYGAEISRIIKQFGLSPYVCTKYNGNGRIELVCARSHISQMQYLELVAEIYYITGQIGYYNPYEEIQTDTTDIYIPESSMIEKKYDTESGMHVREMDVSPVIDGAAEITDQGIIDMYMDIAELSNSDFYIHYCPECNGKNTRLYAFDKVKYDNSKLNGEFRNWVALREQIYYSVCLDRYAQIHLNTGTDADEVMKYIDEKYNLTENSVRIRNSSGMIYMSSFHYLTVELADEICSDLKEKGYLNYAKFELWDNNTGFAEERAGFVYPEKAEEEIRKIINDMGLNVCIRKYPNLENSITLDFADVENITQIEVVNLRYNIYKSTGLKGIGDSKEYTPSYNGVLQFGVTNATAVPGKTTYVDITLGQNTGFFTFISQLDYDHDNLELISASLKNDIAENLDFVVSGDCIIVANKKPENLNMSNQDVIRLGFRIKNDAPDGKYEIKLSAPETEKTGVCCINNNEPKWVNSEFTSGYINVNKNAVPETEVRAMPLKRMYALIDSRNSEATGDVNSDGTLNVMDIMRMKRYLVGTDVTVGNADVNEDGKINIADMIILSDFILNVK